MECKCASKRLYKFFNRYNKSKQNISGATIINIKHKSGTDIKLTTQELDYNFQDFQLNLEITIKRERKLQMH